MLLPEQRQTLLRIARESIAGAFDGRRPELAAADFDETLRRPAGAFVTLTERGELRGCIGSIQPVAPLFQAVSQSALNAAFRDPRFHPLRRDELPLIHLEISVMGPIEPTSPEEVEVGLHGLIVSRGHQAGLLLPQVPVEYAWDRETFLQHTCLKAGLPRDAWRLPDVRLERFAAEVFGEP